MIIPFDPNIAFLCINGVATPVPAADQVDQAQALHADYYNGPSNVTQDQMNAWCAHPTHDGLVSDKQPTPTVLPTAGISALQVVILIAMFLIVLSIFRNPK